MNEEWRAIPGFEGYEVSDQGRVRSYRTNSGQLTNQPHLLKRQLSDTGYYRVFLYLDRKSKPFLVHRLVLTSFIGEGGEFEGRHMNRDRLDNRLSNLKWGTKSENELDKRNHGVDNRGARHGRAKLTEADVRAIRESYGPSRGRGARPNGRPTLKGLAAQYGVAFSVVAAIVDRSIWIEVS